MIVHALPGLGLVDQMPMEEVERQGEEAAFEAVHPHPFVVAGRGSLCGINPWGAMPVTRGALLARQSRSHAREHLSNARLQATRLTRKRRQP